ncbi:BTB/POZ domain-containing protein [Aspergillus undulatus]|uniref:BTB/POZ domain-containing protein n=1 Tax=Aspergillus undulatus TaxID=1810928 RepID=UPI003CCE09F8
MPESVDEQSTDGHSDETQYKAADIIELQVGERRFITTRQTLVEGSTYFESLLSGRWNTTQADGSYFVNADPGLFEHILRYLRRPSAPPLFYDIVHGHNFPMYNALLEEAKYFGIDPLIEWLQKRKYIESVQIVRSIEKACPATPVSYFAAPLNVMVDSGTRVDYHPHWVTEKVYLCPRKIERHRGHPAECGKWCDLARGGDPVEYEDERRLNVMAVKESVSIKIA